MLTQTSNYVITGSEGEDGTMAKMVKASVEIADAYEATRLIREKHDKEGLSFEKIAAILKKKGFVSSRTKKPISLQTVNNYYYYGPNPRKPLSRSEPVPKRVTLNAENQTEKTLGLIIQLVNSDHDPDATVKMIKAALSALGYGK